MNDCIEWTGYRTANGYGLTGGKAAHRVTYERQIGPIPTGLVLDHLCRNRGCVNVEHLEPVTQQENLRRGNGNGSKTHCPQGHPYDETNTIRRSNRPRSRECATCRRDNAARYYATHRGRR